MSGAGRRLEWLRGAAFNTARLSARAVLCDLSTDVRVSNVPVLEDRGYERLEEALDGVLGGHAGFIVTARGRVAESAVCAALIRPGSVVLANEVYVTGGWSIAREGGVLRDIGGALVNLPGRGPVEGLSRGRVAEAIEGGEVACIWLTTPRVLLGARGGAAVDLEAIIELGVLRDQLAPDLPVVIDATKIGEWAARASSVATPGEALRRLGEVADVLLLSARKDAGGVPRGLIIAREAQRLETLRTLGGRALAGGERPSEHYLGALAQGLGSMPTAALGEWRELDRIARELVDGGAAIAGWGGGALFIDAERALPGVPREESPALTLLALLYLRVGLRGLGTPLRVHGPSQVRLSLRGQGGWLREHLGPLLAELRGFRSGLVADGLTPPGPFLDGMVPVEPSAWEGLGSGRSAPRTVGPSVLGGGLGDELAALVRELLGIPRLQVEPLRRPGGRLAEVWARLRRPSAVLRGDPSLAELSRVWRTPAGGEVGDLRVCGVAGLRGALDERQAGDLVIVVLDTPSAWRAAAEHSGAAEVDAWLVTPGSLQADAGALLVPSGTILSAALSESVLFTVGSPGSGGLDRAELSQMAATLAHHRRPS